MSQAHWLTRRVHHPDAPRLGALVADPDAFVADDLFRRRVWSPANGRQPDQFATPGALWADVLNRGARTPTFRLVRDGRTLPHLEYCRQAGIGHRTIDDVIQPNRVHELHAAGATMVLQGLQFTDPHLARLATNLALDLGHAVQVNAYLTPPGTRGLELHFDYHDVFVLQLDGAKRWRVWDPIERTRLPVRTARVPMPTLDELGPPDLDLTLGAGDCLYLPRGFPHAAETVEASSSHLTIGVLALTWQQAVKHAVDAAIADVADVASTSTSLRESIRAESPDRPGLEELAAHLGADAVARWVAREVWRRQPATRLRPLHPPVVDALMPLVLTPGPLLWLSRHGDRCELGLGDRTLTMPVEAHALLAAALQREGTFTLSQLDVSLDESSRLVVGRRLAIEGVVEPAG